MKMKKKMAEQTNESNERQQNEASEASLFYGQVTRSDRQSVLISSDIR